MKGRKGDSAETSPGIRPQRGFTPLPNLLIDQVMPALGDTEWRLLVVIARQTLGWKRMRKQAAQTGRGGSATAADDWLTQSQLKARTGRASASVSRALDSLVKQGYVAARSEAGGPLDTPQKRRAHTGRIRYRLSDALLALCGAASSAPSPYSLSGVQKANTTKESIYKREIQNKEVQLAEPCCEKAMGPVRLYSGWQSAADIASCRRRFQPPDCPLS